MARELYTLDGPTIFEFPHSVRHSGQITLQVQGGAPVPESAYSVAGVGPRSVGVTVRWPGAPDEGETLLISKEVPAERLTDFTRDQGVTGDALNAEYNRIYDLLNELSDRIDQIEFGMRSVRTVDAPTTIWADDSGGLVRLEAGEDKLFRLPEAAEQNWQLGTTVYLRQVTEGRIVLDPDEAVTVKSPASLATRTSGSTIGLVYVGEDVWDLTGDVALGC